MFRNLKLMTLVVLLGLGVILAPALGLAETQKYNIELVEKSVKMGKAIPISVHITETATGKTITDATIAGQKLRMNMGTMTMPGDLTALPSDANGNFRFNCDLTMAGEWQLDLVAKIPGEKDPYLAMLKFEAVK